MFNLLSSALFRSLWLVSLVANIGFWIQSTANASLMLEMGGSALLVALIQTAITLPAFVLGLPVGVLADHFNRRRLLISAHTALAIICALAIALLMQNLLNPYGLLAMVLLIGIASTFSLPVVQASIADTAPKEQLIGAVSAHSVAYNAARAIGPAIAGVVISGLGIKWLFMANLALQLYVLALLIWRYKPKPQQQKSLAPFAFMDSIKQGVVYLKDTQKLHIYIYLIALFVFFSSALWSLLPMAAKRFNDPGAYGYFLSALGIGAVMGGVCLPRIRRSVKSVKPILWYATAVFACAMLVLTRIDSFSLCVGALLAAGFAWVLFSSSLNSSFQTQLVHELRARAIAILLLCYQGSMALGGVFWGVIAQHSDALLSISLAAQGLLLMACGMLRLKCES